MSVATTRIEDGVGILEINAPPVNALGLAVRVALVENIDRFVAAPDVQAILLICAGRTFFAGADISELGKPPQPPDSRTMAALIENASKPIVAAIHGTALGGGYEIALICHHRIAVPSAQFGLPEVRLGLLPGGGGTQRLPRVVGPEASLDLMTSGRRVSAQEALDLGMIDALATEGRLCEDGIAFARRTVAEGRPLRRVRDRQEKVDPYKGDAKLFADFRERNAEAFLGFKAQESIIKAVEAAVNLPFDQGVDRERELFTDLRRSPESAAQRYYFFAEREAAKIPDLAVSTPTIAVERVGVVGADERAEVAAAFLDAGLPVVLVEAEQAALDRALDSVRRGYWDGAYEGRLDPAEIERRLALLTPTLDVALLASADLVIEAAPGKPEAPALDQLDRTCKPGAILAFSASSLDLEEIAIRTARHDRVLGLHLHPPMGPCRLVEVVRGRRTAPEAVAAVMRLAKRIGHVGVLSCAGEAPVAERIMSRSASLARQLVQQGLTLAQIDEAIRGFGFAAAPFAVSDAPEPWRGLREAGPSPDHLVTLLLCPAVNEGARMLEEGVVSRSSDIDVVSVLACGWPVYKGGPMFWADMLGLDRIVEALENLEETFGSAFHPAALLVEKARTGGGFMRVGA